MKYRVPAALAMILITPAAGAQTSAPNPAVSTPAQQARQDKVKGERQTCRSDAQAKGLKGPALRTAIQECMAQVDPKAAKRMTCAKSGKDKGLAGADLKTSIRQCMTAG